MPERWPGETVFVVAGGPSVRDQPLELLQGRRIIAINSSYTRLAGYGLPPPHLPHIDYLLVGDNRWWVKYRDDALGLPCEIVTTAQKQISDNDPRVLKLRKHHPPGLPLSRGSLTMRRTTLSAGISLAAFLAPRGNIVLLGADGKFGDDGARNHHAPHPFPHRVGCWDRHYAELKTLVAPLKLLGINVVNASPGTAWDLWPVVSLRDAV